MGPMQKSNAFLGHIVERIDRIDKAALKNYVKDLAEDIGCYQRILDELEEGILLVTRSGTIELANRSAIGCLGLPKKTSKAVAVQDIDDKQVANFLGRNVPVIRERMVQDFNILSPREQWMRAVLTPSDHLSNSYVIIVLLNQHREMEIQLDAARIARIESLIKLAAGVAHEIGNPLNSLSIHAQLLKKEAEKLPKATRKQFESSLFVINAETDRLDRIVRNFLKATRKPPLKFCLESITAVMEEAIDFLTPELRKKRIDVIYRGDDKTPYFLMDRDRIYQIFINLLKNAMESMASKGGELVIRIDQKEKVVSISSIF